MAKQLTILFSDRDYSEIQKLARIRGMSTEEWVRNALKLARCSNRSPGNVDNKLAAIRAATRCNYPSGDISSVLSEIEHGYTGRPNLER